MFSSTYFFIYLAKVAFSSSAENIIFLGVVDFDFRRSRGFRTGVPVAMGVTSFGANAANKLEAIFTGLTSFGANAVNKLEVIFTVFYKDFDSLMSGNTVL
jgi:hypothetical protein